MTNIRFNTQECTRPNTSVSEETTKRDVCKAHKPAGAGGGQSKVSKPGRPGLGLEGATSSWETCPFACRPQPHPTGAWASQRAGLRRQARDGLVTNAQPTGWVTLRSHLPFLMHDPSALSKSGARGDPLGLSWSWGGRGTTPCTTCSIYETS